MYNTSTCHTLSIAEIMDGLNLQAKNIFNFYLYIINKNHYEINIMKEKCHINQLKDQIIDLHFILHQEYLYKQKDHHSSLLEPFQYSLKILEYFYRYYNQCGIILDTYQLNINLIIWYEFLFNDPVACLKEDECYTLIGVYNKIIDGITLLQRPVNQNIYSIIQELIRNYNNIMNIYIVRSKQFLLLTADQEFFVNLYFKYNKNQNKFSKKTTIKNLQYQPKELVKFINNNPNILPLSYSVLIDRSKNKIFAIFPSKTIINQPLNSCNTIINGLIGEGSYGKVKLAQDLTNHSIIVVKIQIIHKKHRKFKDIEISNEERIQELLNYFIGSTRVNKPKKNIFKYYTFSKYIKGENLNIYLEQNKHITINEMIAIFIKILEELNYFHNHVNIVHGDLNFLNILYDPKTCTLKIIDFGFSAIADQYGMIRFRHLKSNKNKGELYFAEECYSMRKATYASDIYSLGWWIKLYITNHYLQLSASCMDLLNRMLNQDYNLRPTVMECIQGFTALLNSNSIINQSNSNSNNFSADSNKLTSSNNVSGYININQSISDRSNVRSNKIQPRPNTV